MSILSDHLLASRVFRAKDPRAFEELFTRHAPRVRRFLVTRLPRPEDADDLVAEVFLRGWEYLTTSTVEHPSALLYRVARNLVADFYRKQKETVALEDAERHLTPANISAISQGKEIASDAEALLGVIQQLDEESKEIVLLFAVAEMKPREIASIVGKTPNGVRIALHRAKKQIRLVWQEKRQP